VRHDPFTALSGWRSARRIHADRRRSAVIYSGAYTLAEGPLSVAGRGVVLDINYRNTAQIVAVA